MARKYKKGGVEVTTALDKTKKYKYDSTGDLVESTGTPGANEIVFSGSKSSLRRMADAERNISILATTLMTTDGTADDGDNATYGSNVNKKTRFKKEVRMDAEVQVKAGVDMNSTKITELDTPTSGTDAANKTYVDTQIANLGDTAPAALNTLNELAAAMNDDASFSTTVTNSIATKLPLAGGTMSGNIAMGGNDITGGGDATFTNFNGTATYAKYADLAERYAADATYEEGTVMSFGGEAEVTSAVGYGSTKIAGVVSTKPAFAMNDAAGNSETHPFIALQGRVPCKVVGTVSKGDILVASEISGTATVWTESTVDPRMTAYVGIAIEDKNTDGAGYVEVKVGK
jgi:hypothetical protein